MISVQAFRCEFCGKLYMTKHHCKKHEAQCGKNPENIPACFGMSDHANCNHLGYEEQRMSGCSYWVCGKLDRDMITRRMAVKRDVSDWKEHFEIDEKTPLIIMPKHCKFAQKEPFPQEDHPYVF